MVWTWSANFLKEVSQALLEKTPTRERSGGKGSKKNETREQKWDKKGRVGLKIKRQFVRIASVLNATTQYTGGSRANPEWGQNHRKGHCNT